MTGFQVRRVYDEPSADDGRRVLVDRLWPRGLSKDRAQLDEWAKELAPSSELRGWLHADRAGRFAEFAARYTAELDRAEVRDQLDALRAHAAKGTVTLLTSVADPEHSHVPVLLDCLRQH
jgi:uncharacterized protein YeaO (DUF488 family)